MNYLYLSGSPRKNGNTEELLKICQNVTGGELLRIDDFDIASCSSCWKCIENDNCVIEDDMTNELIPKIIDAKAIIIGSPVYFNNITAPLKCFMDRTWSIKGKLKNKIGGAVVVGRKYGAESAITAINSFFLKHEMIPANRGVHGVAFEKGEIKTDKEAQEAAAKLGERLQELDSMIYS